GIIEGSITGTLKYTRISNNITTTEYAPIFDNLGSYPGYLPDDQSVTYNNENSRLVVTFNGINNIPSGYRVRSSELALSNSIPTSGSVSRSEIYGDIDIKLFTSNSLYGTQVHYDACSVGTTLGTKKTGFFPVILDNSSLNNAVINAIPNNRVSFSLVSVGALCSITYTHLDIYLELIPRYSITTVVNPSGSGTISLSPAPGADGKYEQGTLVTATASPSSGWQFYNWSDANNSQSNQISFTVNSNASLNANFIKQLQINGPVELPTNGSATYTVTTIPDATTYKWYKLVKQTTYPYGTTYSYQSTGTSYVGVMGTGAIPLVLIMKVEAYDASNALRGSGIIAVEASEN
ncbi:MAG TPA: hypothetical protein PL129_04855, partial [bacterium]|nr:hypothetical protein [bacterium]